MILEHKKLLLEGVLSLHSVLVLDGLLPHSHELPLLELFEEVLFFDVVVRVSFDQPLSEGQELDWSVVFV